MAINRAALTALIAANIADNTSEAITPALHRAVENALNDSNVNWIDDVKTTLNNSNNEVPTSAAVLGNKPIKRVLTLADWNNLISSSGLVAGYAYLVNTEYTDPIWAYEWTAFMIAASANTIEPIAFAYAPSFVPEFVRINTNEDFSSWMFLETCGLNMYLTAAQANQYNIDGNSVIAPFARIIVEMGSTTRYETIIWRTGTSISPIGKSFTDGAGLGNFVFLDYANDVEYTLNPFVTTKLITEVDFQTGGQFTILPAPPLGYFWLVIDASAKVNFNTNGFDPASNEIYIKNDTAAIPVWELLQLDTVVAGFVISRGNLIMNAQPQDNYIEATALVADIPTAAGVTYDGDVVLYVTAQLTPLT